MKTLSLIEAADLLHMSPSSLRAKAKEGIVPASKPGKRWVFIQQDLFDFLRSQQQEVKAAARRGLEVVRCHSIDEAKSGGSDLPRRRASEYASRLGLEIDARHRNSTIA
jgi:hypothetical protein